jgi:ADP-heptose:LPS heptosyltransferase
LRALGLGDLLTIVPAWRALARKFPGYRRILATPRAFAPIVELLGAEHLPVNELEALPPMRVALGVNLHGCGPQSDEVLLARRPARLIAFAHRDVPATDGGPKWDPDEHEVARWCRLLRSAGIECTPDDLELEVPPSWYRAGTLASAIDAGTTVVHPGAGFGARRWPVDRFAAVARAERARGRAVVVTGSRSERALGQRLVEAAGLPRASLLAGRTDVAALTAIVARAGRVVCGDTGVAHVATAVQTPSVVLFGPTSPATWGPPRKQHQHRVLWAGHVGNPRSEETDRGLLEIGVDDVVRELARLPG